jgi:uncharacterized protein YjbI with pentapeptide repeats
MAEQQNEMTSATTNTTGPDDSEPTPERQAELRKAYQANAAVGKPPYASVEIDSSGELNWIMRTHKWVGSSDAPGRRANLSGADLYGVNLKGVQLYRANLSDTDLALANLAEAHLVAANLIGARLWETNLSGADLREVIMDESTRLRDMTMSKKTKVSDVGWNNAQLARVKMWPERLGDEATITNATTRAGR